MSVDDITLSDLIPDQHLVIGEHDILVLRYKRKLPQEYVDALIDCIEREKLLAYKVAVVIECDELDKNKERCIRCPLEKRHCLTKSRF